MRDGKIHFRDSDQDALHLWHPVLFRKWFTARGYEVVHFNRFGSRWRAMWNGLCPSLATSNGWCFASPSGGTQSRLSCLVPLKTFASD